MQIEEDQKRHFVRQYQMRQGYSGTSIETHRNRFLIVALLLILAALTGFYYGWIGR